MKIVFSGYDGKMGSKILEYLKINIKHEIIDLINKDSEFPFKSIPKADVVIDFSIASFAYELACVCAKNKVSLISGTTNISKQKQDELDKLFKENDTGMILCPNFSKGINLINKISPLLSSSYKTFEIEETHHISKLDSPSGTALQLKSKLNRNINIYSKRKKHYNAVHKLICKDEYEEFIIIHKVKNKFAYGDLVINAINIIKTFKGLKNEI